MINLLRSLLLALSAPLSTSGQSVISWNPLKAFVALASVNFSEIFLCDAGRSNQLVVLIVDQNECIAKLAVGSVEAQGGQFEGRGYSITISPGLPESRKPLRGRVDARARLQMSCLLHLVLNDGR